MLRVIDTDGLSDVRSRLLGLEQALSDRHLASRNVLVTHGRPDVTWRLTNTESWLATAAVELDRSIDAARLTAWLDQTPGRGVTPHPVTAWDAVYSALGPVIAAHHLDGLSKNEQRLIARWRSSTIATLRGAPLLARTEANRRLIDLEVGRMEVRIAEIVASLANFPAGTTAHRWRTGQIDELRAQQDVLRRIADRNPIWFEAGEDGRFMEWIGPEDAAHVVFLVPGTGHSVWTADDLRATGTALREASMGVGSESVAVVIAMGYDAPNTIPAAGFSSYAHHGGPELARILDSVGIGNDRHVTVIGHSYGSYVATRALSELHSFEVDELVLVGSPGVGVESAGDIPLDAGHIWAGLTDNDSITLTSSDRWLTWLEKVDLNPFDWKTWDVRRDGTYEDLWFGTNPAHPSFGAQRLEMFEADGHSGYFGGSEQNDLALDNLARVFIGVEPILDE